MTNLRDRMALAKCTINHTSEVHQEARKFSKSQSRKGAQYSLMKSSTGDRLTVV